MSTPDMRNTTNIKSVIKKAFDTIMSVRSDRQELNEMMADAREMMENAGISKKVFAMAQNYLVMDQEDREAFKEFFEMIQEVLDEDFQPTLFDQEKEKKRERDQARKQERKAAAEKSETSSDEDEKPETSSEEE